MYTVVYLSEAEVVIVKLQKAKRENDLVIHTRTRILRASLQPLIKLDHITRTRIDITYVAIARVVIVRDVSS